MAARQENGADSIPVAGPQQPTIAPPGPARQRLYSLSVILLGLGGVVVYALLTAQRIPPPTPWVDTENFDHWINANFEYASSAIDLSVISPVQGLGGLLQPIGVWINPAYVIPRALGIADSRAGTYIVIICLLALVTFLLGRSLGLPVPLAVIGGQVLAIFSCHPMYAWSWDITHLNGAHLYTPLPGFAIPVILGTLFLSLFCALGRLSMRGNVACVASLPLVAIYSVLCDPLYTAVFWVPVAVFTGGIVLGSGSRSVFRWQAAGAVLCLVVALAVDLHGFYRGIIGYAARATFPNELYVEVQQWDYLTALAFQGGLATVGVAFVAIACIVGCIFGTTPVRGFLGSVLGFLAFMVIVSHVYVYSGIRWNQPLPVYLEVGAHPAYVVAALLGTWLTVRKLALLLRLPAALSKLAVPLVLVLPLFAMICIWRVNDEKIPIGHIVSQENNDYEPTGVVKFLADDIGLRSDGRFRGSVVSLVGVPGGELATGLGFAENAPFTKEHIDMIGYYPRTFDPKFYMTGLWSLGIPTLEDNNHLVTPPFHYLVSRALSRPQDYHSRNWVFITKIEPKLMAALGTRILLTDRVEKSPLLTERYQQMNGDHVPVYAYELAATNTGNYSPTKPTLAATAAQSIALMTSEEFSFQDRVIVYDESLPPLTPATGGEMFFEKGGVRVRGRTDGTSLLVLPIQFSNSLCITAVGPASTSHSTRLLRVNLLQTGLLFDGELDIRLTHVFGLFRGVKGRLQDIEDCRRLGIQEDGTIPYPPGYQPLANRPP